MYMLESIYKKKKKGAQGKKLILLQAWACPRRVYNKRDSIVLKSNLVEHCPWNLFFSSRSRMSCRGIARYNIEFLSYITLLNNKRLIEKISEEKRKRERFSKL